MVTWTERVIQQWKLEKISLNPPATLSAIREAEQFAECIFPEQFKELYLLVDGFRDWDTTPNMFSIWPLDRILEEYFKEGEKKFVGFADFLINSYHIGFVKKSKGIYKSYDELNPIAQTFQEAIYLINTDSPLIY